MVLMLRLVFLLEQVEGEIISFIADGACDGEPVYQAVADKQPDPPPDVVIPPRASAAPSTHAVDPQSQRNKHIRLIAKKGRMGWQKATGYGRRSLVETAICPYKHLIGSKLRARSSAAQQGEVATAVETLNRIIRSPSHSQSASHDVTVYAETCTVSSASMHQR
jgi:hypothetical protein